MAHNVKSTIYFMRKDDIHNYEKPYALRFVAETEFPPTNFTLEPNEGIIINDMRDYFEKFSIEENGFAVLKLPHQIHYEEYHESKGLQKYFDALEDLLREHLSASDVRVFRHSLRKRHPEFPKSTGNSYTYDQPTSVAHVDTTPKFTLEEVERRMGDESQHLQEGRIQWINVWKPLRGPVNDWPLAVCDAKSLDPLRDFESADLLFENSVAENYQVHHHQDQRWYYLSDHSEDELIVFKQSDTDVSASAGVAHSSFFNILAKADEPPRESIEVRLLVFYV